MASQMELIDILRKRFVIKVLMGYRNKNLKPDAGKLSINYYDSIKVPVLNRLTTYLTQMQAFSLLILSFRPDIIVFDITNPLLLLRALSLKKKKDNAPKLILDIRTLPVLSNVVDRYIFNKIFRINLRFAAKHFDGITYITEEMRNFCISRYDLPLHQSVIWTSGVNPDRFRAGTCKCEDKTLILLYHGAIDKKRGIDNVINALPLLKDIDVRLDLLGGGDALNDLKKLTLRLGVMDKVSFLNRISYNDVPKWINHGHVGILPLPDWPGWNTSSPLKLFEYLSCGKPVIVNDIPAHRNVLRGEELAFWIKDTSPKEIAKVIRRVYEQKWKLKSLKNMARSVILTRHTWQHQANILGQFLEEL